MIVELVKVRKELNIKANGLLVLYVFRLLMKKFDLNNALNRYLSLAAVATSQVTLIMLNPDILNVVEVNSNRF